VRVYGQRQTSAVPDPAEEAAQRSVVPLSNQMLLRAIVPARPATADITSPGDAVERDADRLAERATPSPSGAAELTGPSSGPGGGALPRIVVEALASGGHPLNASTRTLMEGRFGRDFGGVRVHTSQKAGRSAEHVDAAAYSVGSDVVFGPGRYAPGSASGQHLLAHELAHVVQPASQGALLRRFHLPHGTQPGHQVDETALIAPNYAAMLTTIRAIVNASIASGTTVNMDRFVQNAGGQPASREIDRTLGTQSTAVVQAMLDPRYLLTRRAGLLDLLHFCEMLYIAQFTASAFQADGNRSATRRGREHELTAESESRFGPEDTVSNALGAYTGSRLAVIPQSDDLFARIKEMLDRCDPVDFATLSAASKDKVRHFYGDLVNDPAPRQPGDLIPRNQNPTAVPEILEIPEFAGAERSFPFELDSGDPDRKTISDTAFLSGSAGLSSDGDIRDFVATQRPEVIRDLSAAEKVRLVSRLFEGWVADEDLNAIEVIYRNSTDPEKQQIRAAVDPANLRSGDQQARLRRLFAP
jgi:hypothetical protein